MVAMVMIVIAADWTARVKGSAKCASDTADHIQIRMLKIHTCINHRHIHIRLRRSMARK